MLGLQRGVALAAQVERVQLEPHPWQLEKQKTTELSGSASSCVCTAVNVQQHESRTHDLTPAGLASPRSEDMSSSSKSDCLQTSSWHSTTM